MKRIILAVCLVLVCGVVWAADIVVNPSICPRTRMTRDCTLCHTIPSFALKEVPPDAHLVYPVGSMRVIGAMAYYTLEEIQAERIQAFFDYILWHPQVKHIVIEIHSPGGSLFDAHKIIGMMQHMIAKGYIIETRVYGFAASAGFFIAASGSKGYRFVSCTAQLMWHELMSLTIFSIDTPSDSEEKSRVLRHLQDTANNWLASVSKLTIDQLNEKIRKKEFWMSGKEAIKYGFADGELR
ncbi:MAG: ATP-dependent Clp protease proteolytic subunit [Magnetococcus sp. WYHC-3]